MKAIMYGGGNIGRGFIGALFYQSGYDVTFIDVVEKTIAAINREHRYPVRIVSSEGYEEQWIENVRAVNGNDLAQASRAIADADIMATAVGVNAMKFIVPVIVGGLKLRCQEKSAPLNIIICENLIDANKVLEKMLKEKLTEEECAWFDENVGLVEASIGRMVPVQTEAMQDGNPLRVCVERYGFLPVDKDAFRGAIPEIKHMVPFSPFDFYIRRKLYVHNMGHATCAYMGMLLNDTYIYEAIADPDVRIICQSAMTQSAIALGKTYGVEVAGLFDHVLDLLKRFENKALMDTCARVGGDTTRKLKPTDRLIGSARLCMEHGVRPAYIALGAAAALRAHCENERLAQTQESAKTLLQELSGLDANEELTGMILSLYALICQKADMRALRMAADRLAVGKGGTII